MTSAQEVDIVRTTVAATTIRRDMVELETGALGAAVTIVTLERTLVLIAVAYCSFDCARMYRVDPDVSVSSRFFRGDFDLAYFFE